MGFLASLLAGGASTKIAGIVLLVIITIAGTIIGLKTIEVNHLQKKVDELTANNIVLTNNNKVLKDNQIVLSTANDTNLDTIKKLEAERQDSKNAIASLAAANKRDKTVLNVISNKIDEMAKDPKNDGAVSPVLKETIKSIQEQRSKK